jgi:hypothetical protein
VSCQPANRFQWCDLVYLLWKNARTFDFNLAHEHELRAVLAAIEMEVKLPNLTDMEIEICNCELKLVNEHTDHRKHCPVRRFRRAIER